MILLDHFYSIVYVHSTSVVKLQFANHYTTYCIFNADSAKNSTQRHLTSQYCSFKDNNIETLISNLQSVQLLPEDKICSVVDMAISYHFVLIYGIRMHP